MLAYTHKKKQKYKKDTHIKQLSLINFKSLEKSSLLPNVAKLVFMKNLQNMKSLGSRAQLSQKSTM